MGDGLLGRSLELDENLRETKDPEERRDLIRRFLNERPETPEIPEFGPDWDWFNVSRPISVARDLKNRITVLDFFTYCCVNCLHVLPVLEDLEHQFKSVAVAVVGVHSAKFPNEKASEKVRMAVERYGITHPVVNDSECILWNELSVTCWPTLVICDSKACPVKMFVGEAFLSYLSEFIGILLEEEGLADREPLNPLPVSVNSKPLGPLFYPGKAFFRNKEELFVSDTGRHRILAFRYSNCEVTKVIGSGIEGFRDGSFEIARFSSPQGMIYVEDEDCLYVADTGNHAIRKVNFRGEMSVETVVGTGKQGHDLEGGKFGTDQEIASPWDLTLGLSPNGEDVIYIAMAGTHQIWAHNFKTRSKWWKGVVREVSECFRVAGTGNEENRNNSYPHKASFAQPSGLAFHRNSSSLFIADSESSSIRRLNIKDGSVKAVVGGARDPTDLFASGDVSGDGFEAKLQHPLGVACINDEVYLADSYNHKIKVITNLESKAPTINTLNLAESLNEPSDVCFASVNVYLIVDSNNHRIIEVSPEGERVLPLKFTEKSSKFDTEIRESLRIKSRPGNVQLRLKFLNSSGKKFSLNPDAPNSWKLILPSSDWSSAEDALNGQIADLAEILRLNLTYQEGIEKEGDIKIEVRLVGCDPETETCSMKTALITLRCLINQDSDAAKDITIDI